MDPATPRRETGLCHFMNTQSRGHAFTQSRGHAFTQSRGHVHPKPVVTDFPDPVFLCSPAPVFLREVAESRIHSPTMKNLSGLLGVQWQTTELEIH
jgi:hypothetical protein